MAHQWIWQLKTWPHFAWDEEVLAAPLAAARLAQGRLLGLGRMLDGSLSGEALGDVLVEEGLTTSAIEGELLNPDQVRSSVARHLGLPTAGLPAPGRDVDGLITVLLDAVRRHEEPLNLDRLLGWHASLFPGGRSGLHRIKTGTLRGGAPMQVVSGPQGREKVHFEAPPRLGLEAEVERFLAWFNGWKAEEGGRLLDGLLRAGIAHFWFVTLHPFEDGNGRLARAITDLALAQDERRTLRLFSMSSQILLEREAYYTILEKEQTSGHGLDVTAWLAWFLTQLAAACGRAEHTVERTLYKARFWLRFRELPLSERQRKVLNRLLDAGAGGFEGGLTARKYMGMTKASKATATRDLADLAQVGCLVPTGKGGRSAAYGLPELGDSHP